MVKYFRQFRLIYFLSSTLCPPDHCKTKESLQNLCEQIPGDANLFSMFKVDAEPVKCPLKGKVDFYILNFVGYR